MFREGVVCVCEHVLGLWPVLTSEPSCSEHLLSAGGRHVQQSPGSMGVQLLLVTTQRPNIHHPQDLLLQRGTQTVHNYDLPNAIKAV